MAGPAAKSEEHPPRDLGRGRMGGVTKSPQLHLILSVEKSPKPSQQPSVTTGVDGLNCPCSPLPGCVLPPTSHPASWTLSSACPASGQWLLSAAFPGQTMTILFNESQVLSAKHPSRTKVATISYPYTNTIAHQPQRVLL